jgi:site-specific recombinase XerD
LKSTALVPVGSLALSNIESPDWLVPAVVADTGDGAAERFIEFFTANIHNKNTRAAYGRAVADFLAWYQKPGRSLKTIKPVLVAEYIGKLENDGLSKPTVKQHLAAIRMMFDWMVTGGFLPFNPEIRR